MLARDLRLRASEWMDSEWPHADDLGLLGLVLTREVVCGWRGPVETQPAKKGLQLTTSYAACWQASLPILERENVKTRAVRGN